MFNMIRDETRFVKLNIKKASNYKFYRGFS
jgi:hypothetical protein